TLNGFESKITEPWRQAEGRGSRAEGSERASNSTHNPVPSTLDPRPSTLNASIPSRAEAIHTIHFPSALDDIETARRRLALDEFIALQRQMQLRRKQFETKAQALPCGGDNRLIKPLLAQLGFKLTEAQTQVLRQLRKDMSGVHPMRRLLQ